MLPSSDLFTVDCFPFIDLDKPGVNLIKKFGVNLLLLFCKLHLFVPLKQILLMFIKWFGLPKVSKFMPKMFYEFDPWGQSHRAFW
jgi:hypothetical protein